MVFLGFAAGLPFLLVFSTLTYWLSDAQVDKSTIGFFTWIGITYSIKVFWAPVIDRLPLVLLSRMLGQRRAWMLLAQLTIVLGLAGMAMTDPATQLTQLALLALLVAFGSSTQDISVDAWRIEAVERDLQGAMAATYVLGYRLALLVAGAGALYLAEFRSWPFAYLTMAALMGVGIITTLIIREPQHVRDAQTAALEEKLEHAIGISNRQSSWQRLAAWFSDAVVSPFVEFFHRNGALAILVLLLVGAYKLSDITMGAMAGPFYLDLGFSKTEIANITKVFGFFMTIAGASLGGILVVRFGILRPLLAGAILVASTNLLFVWLANSEPDLTSLAVVISADNLSGGLATSAFIAWLSSLVNKTYTATQYALFSSLMTLPAKFVGGFSGIVVDAAGYATFFLYAGLLGIPAILLVTVLMYRQRSATAAA
ncbi:MAG: MFS transporter [Gammaproteobacteria bacterium]|nr:MFS transporter [Gammaproteobacteria bacterium]